MILLWQQPFPAPYSLAITWNYMERTNSLQKTQLPNVMKARGDGRRFNLGPCDVTRFLRDKHDRSSRQLGLCKSLILIVYYVSYGAHNYDSVGKEICAKIAVCFDQSKGWKFVQVVAVAMSRNKVARSSNNKMQLIPSGIFKLCNRYTFTVLAQCSQPWWGTGIKYEWLKHWGIEDKRCRLFYSYKQHRFGGQYNPISWFKPQGAGQVQIAS